MSDEKKTIKLMLVDDEEDFLNSLAKRLGSSVSINARAFRK